LWFPSALFPFLECANTDTQDTGKGGLAQAGLLPDRLGIVWKFNRMTDTAAALDRRYAVKYLLPDVSLHDSTLHRNIR
jgi:hypothetical protein